MAKERTFTPDGFLIIGENDTCPYWEIYPTPALIPGKECWFCKWADFREDTTVYRHTSVCRNEINKLPETEEQKP